MRGKSLSILTVVLSLTLASPSVYAGSQEPPIGPAPGPPKAPAEKAKPHPTSSPPGRSGSLNRPSISPREAPAAKPPKPSEAKPGEKSDEKEPESLEKTAGRSPSKPKGFPFRAEPAWPIGKPLQPKDVRTEARIFL